jgi:hypothetical protein
MRAGSFHDLAVTAGVLLLRCEILVVKTIES